MKKVKSIIGISLALLMIGSLSVGCSKKSSAPTKSTAPDTVNALLPPISSNYQQEFTQYAADFNKKYPNLTLKLEAASWDDMSQKLDVEVNAGTPPDVAFIGTSGIAKYADTGLLVDISKIATSDMVKDFDSIPLQYMKSGKGLYGFPAYMSIWSLGGNKEMLEAAGIDWKSIQQNGWTYDEFLNDIERGTVKNGNTTSRYGFVFACSGVTATDFLNMLVNEAGMPAPFTTDLKYAYTSKNFLTLLNDVQAMINTGAMPNNLNSVDAGTRWNMFLTGQTMITGKGLTTFENSANINNTKLAANDGSAVKGSIKADYVVLPMPTFSGFKQQASGEVDGYVTFRGKQTPSAAHLTNIVEAAYFLASGEVAAKTNNELFVQQICNSARDAAKSLTLSRDSDNAAEEQRLLSEAAPARPDIPLDLANKANKIMDEVMVPKFQALLSNEITPQQMYNEVKAAAVNAFGQKGIVTD